MLKTDFGHHDPLDYFPLDDGLKPSKLGLRKLNYDNPEKNKFFQLDDKYDIFKENKLQCMGERKSKYYQTMKLEKFYVERFIRETLIKEYPEKFNDDSFDYLSKWDHFDVLARCVSEDLVLHCFKDDKDWVETIHLCNANGWSAEGALNQNMNHLHQGVPGIKKILNEEKTKGMIKGIIKADFPMERVAAISFRTNSILNRHPSFVDLHEEFNLDDPKLFIRLERQVVKGFKKIGVEEDSPAGFLFAIKTYFIDVSKLKELRKQMVIEAFEDNDPNVYSSHFINKNREKVLKWLK